MCYLHDTLLGKLLFQTGEEFQIGPNWNLSKALINGYQQFLFRTEEYCGGFGSLLNNLVFGFVAIE